MGNANRKRITFSLLLLSVVCFSVFSENLTEKGFIDGEKRLNAHKIENHEPRVSDGGIQINENRTGLGTDLDYKLNALGNGSNDEYTRIVEQPILGNTSTNNIGLPNQSIVNNLNLTLSNLEKNTPITQVVNDSVVYSPNYTISYTAISEVGYDNYTWVNITGYDYPGARLGDINITVDGIFNKSFYGSGFHSHKINFTETGLYEIILSFYYANDTFFRNETLDVVRSSFEDSHQEVILYSPPSSPINPYIRLNDDYDSENKDLIAFQFSPDVGANLTSIDLFAKYNLLGENNLYNMSIFICNQTDPLTQTPDLNSILAQNKFNGYGTGFRNTPGWINVDFSDDNAKIYPGINYYLVFNATAIESFEGDNYFDLYTTNFNNDTTQNSKKYESDLNWPDIDPQKAALFRLKTDQYEPTDLTEITVNVSIFNSTGGQTVKSFDPTTNSSYFDENSDEAGPWGEGENVENLVLFFEANYTCRFQYSFDINITQTKTSKPCSFTTHFNKSNVEWETWINATAPEANSGNSKYNASTMNYTVFFPGSWFHFNGTAPENNFTSSMDTPKLYINSSVSRLNWTFRALSPYEVGNITTVPQNRIDFSPGMNITCKVTWNSTEYNASLSFWNITKTPDGASGLGFEVQSATYLDYHENVSRSTSNQSYSHTFPNYTIPLSYTAKNISVKVWWHNQTSAGIFLKTFKIKNNASLVNYTYFEKVGNNQNLTLKYEYLDNNSDPIPNAQISSNWENENWSYSYNITEGAYYIEIHVFKPVGDDYLFGINFSHPDYISRLHEVKIRVLVGTSLILKQGSDQDQIYMNDTLELGFAWYTDTGERISKKEEDPNRNFNITFDGGEINNIPGKTQWIFDHKQTNPNSPNLFITINTRFLDYKDYIDNHNVSLSLLQENATTSYKVQKYTFYFEIKEIPSYLSLYSSNAYQMQKGQKFGRFDGKIVEFENYKENIRLNILYEHNGTHLENMNELVPFNWGELSGYVEDKDLNKKVIKNIGVDSIYDGKEGSGLYFMEFPVSSLIAGHNYELHIICQDTNIAHKDLNVELDIISRWQVRLDLVDIISKTEGEMLTISGQVNFENASDVWNAANQKISIKIQFINDTGVMTEEILTFTESNGSFSFTNWKVPNRDHYQFINISVSIAESRTHHSVSKSIQIEISENIWTRYVIPILITALSLLFGIPLVMKYGVPFFKKRIEKSILIQKARENPKIRNAVNKVSQKVSGKDAFIAPSDKPKVGLDAIKTVKIPRLPDDLNSFSKVSPDTDPESFETDEVEIEPEKKEEEVERTILDKIKRFNTRIKKIQDIFSPKKTQETMLEAKNDNIYKAKLLEENQEYLNAIIHYYFAQEYARRLELDDEVVLLENMMNKLLVKMDAKDQLKFIKKYKVRAEKERKS